METSVPGTRTVRIRSPRRRELTATTVTTDSLTALGFDVVSSEIMTNYYYRPWAKFEYEGDFTSE